jgi:hypothetical protein
MTGTAANGLEARTAFMRRMVSHLSSLTCHNFAIRRAPPAEASDRDASMGSDSFPARFLRVLEQN